MKLTEIYLTKKHVKQEEWLELINSISKYNGMFHKWQIIIKNDKNTIRYFVKTKCSLPATINNLNSFLLKPIQKLDKPIPAHFTLSVSKLGSNIIDLINYSEIKNKGTLEYLEINFF